MARAYSLDLRQKVVEFVLRGESKEEAARVFNIGIDSVYRWLRLYNKTGNLKPKKRVFLPKKVNIESLRAYVAKNPDHTLTEIGVALALGAQTVWKYLKRLKITRKKKRPVMRKAAQKNERNFKKH